VTLYNYEMYGTLDACWAEIQREQSRVYKWDGPPAENPGVADHWRNIAALAQAMERIARAEIDRLATAGKSHARSLERGRR
jgi:hypothetical protein